MLKYEDKWESYYRLEFEKVLESMKNFEKGKYFFYNKNVWSADLKMVQHAKIWG